MLQKAKEKVEYWWTMFKRLMALLCVWGLIFSGVTIGKLGVAFDYDDTLVFSTPAYAKAFAGTPRPLGPQFWSIVNQAYDLEKPKALPWALAWAFKLCGFRVSILAARPDTDGEGLRKEWRHLVPRSRFHFVGEAGGKRRFLEDGSNVLFFGDSDLDVAEGRKAKVFTVRVKRSPKSSYKEDYHPGTMREFVLPFSEF